MKERRKSGPERGRFFLERSPHPKGQLRNQRRGDGATLIVWGHEGQNAHKNRLKDGIALRMRVRLSSESCRAVVAMAAGRPYFISAWRVTALWNAERAASDCALKGWLLTEIGIRSDQI